jgi:hypothetical protein
MAQNIGKRRGKSPIKTRIEQERKASRKDPEGKKAFVKGVGTVADTALTLSAVGPAVRGVGAAVRGYKKYKKIKNTPSIALYRGEPGYKTFAQTRKRRKVSPNIGKWFSTDKDIAIGYSRKSITRGSNFSNELGVLKKVKVSPNEFKAMKKGKLKDTQRNRGNLKYFDKDFFYGTVSPEVRRRAKVIPKNKSGGLTNTVPPKRGPNPQGLKGGGNFDPEGKGYDYKTAKKDHYFNIFRDAPPGAKPHGVSRDRKTGKLLKGRKHDTFSKAVGVDENLGYGLKKKGDGYYTEKLKRGIPAGKYKDMSKFSKGGCPHREAGAKSDIQGIKDIQVKGQKFTGVK